ncbi:hypothetical protein CSOJ01_11221 [Colletotrichum sojae]|uniref:Uncharacterized protein n=1 Tax=Colletotrichum sojae TaxID=2175907 RepID=A0A8H6IXZ9_9PEZI|nr:hypothetical protein CSOJ01_11221 [Colletotrichum sojae]
MLVSPQIHSGGRSGPLKAVNIEVSDVKRYYLRPNLTRDRAIRRSNYPDGMVTALRMDPSVVTDLTSSAFAAIRSAAIPPAARRD